MLKYYYVFFYLFTNFSWGNHSHHSDLVAVWEQKGWTILAELASEVMTIVGCPADSKTLWG